MEWLRATWFRFSRLGVDDEMSRSQAKHLMFANRFCLMCPFAVAALLPFLVPMNHPATRLSVLVGFATTFDPLIRKYLDPHTTVLPLGLMAPDAMPGSPLIGLRLLPDSRQITPLKSLVSWHWTRTDFPFGAERKAEKFLYLDLIGDWERCDRRLTR